MQAIVKDLRNSSGDVLAEAAEDRRSGGAVPLEDLCVEARRAVEDIDYFAYRYFGLIVMPYQEEATEQVVRLLGTPDEEYLVINQPPGTGKSTFFTFVLPAWVTCRDRTITGQIGSASQTMAESYTGRLRTAFTRRVPVRAKPRDLELGVAVDAQATLVEDFGRFRPGPSSEAAWRADQFSVLQHGGVEVSEKEPTWSAFGRDSTFIGLRPRIAIWDDVWDPRKMRTAEAREDMKEWWLDVAEPRLEPGGLMILQGQRLGPDDIYRFALNQSAPVDEDDLDDDELEVREAGELDAGDRKYHHIKFKAHYDDRCRGKETHRRDAAPYPDGCLLFPKRLGWRKVKALRANGAAKFEVIYQQEDVDPESVLVRPEWVRGGVDPESGEMFVGCLDADRGLCELPRDGAGRIALAGPLLSVATADPSPTKFWAVEWWVLDVASGQRFLMDVERKRMEASDLLDRLHPSGKFVGIMEEWDQRAKALGIPIRWWIVETNVANRFLLQYQHVRDWMQRRSVGVVQHDTNRNKADPKMGVESIAPHYHFGRVRLPWRGGPARAATMKLTSEVTRYPEGATDDCVLAHWFFEWNAPRLVQRMRAREAEDVTLRRPAFVRQMAGTR